MNQTIPVLWTNDDIAYGQAPELRRQLEFLDRHAIPGIFFIIPRTTGDIDQDKELLSVIEKARENGHEFYQHGFVHSPFECGVPEIGMLKMVPATIRQYDENRDAIEASHTFDAQVRMLENGQRIWRRAFGENSPGFRPGWGAFCANFYKALAALGYEWVSSRLPCFTSWAWNRGEWDEPIDFRASLPTSPYFHRQGIREFPIAGDYAFRVPNHPRRIDAMAELGLREFEIYFERRDPMLIVSHFHGLEHAGALEGASENPRGTGYAVHEKLIPALLETGRASFIGMTELAARYQTVEKPAAI